MTTWKSIFRFFFPQVLSFVTVDTQQEVGEPLQATFQGKVQDSKATEHPVLRVPPKHIRLHVFCRNSYVCCWFQLNPFHLHDRNLQDTSYLWYVSLSKLPLSFDNQLLDRAWAPTELTRAHRGPHWNVWHAAYIFSRKKVSVLLLLNSQFGSCKGPIKLVLTNYFVVKAVTSSRSLSFIAARFYTKTVILV